MPKCCPNEMKYAYYFFKCREQLCFFLTNQLVLNVVYSKNEGSSSSLHCAFCCWGFSIRIFSDCKGKPRFLRLFGFSILVPTFSNILFKFELNSQKKCLERKAACTTHLRILIRKLLNSLSHSHCTTNIFFFSESDLFEISCYFLESK